MTRKPPDQPPGVGRILLALWVIANFATSANAQQQPQQQQQQQQHLSPSAGHQLAQSLQNGKSTWVDTTEPGPFLDEQDSGLRDSTDNQQSLLKKRKNSDAAPNQKDRRADLILYAPDERSTRDAVRAPAIPVRGTAGPRSLQDWKIEDVVLLATVDGTIHLTDRDNGREIWTWGLEEPMVETRYYATNKSTDGTAPPPDPLLEKFIWIVEPSQDGALYGYTPGMGGLQKLGLTVKELVNDVSGFESDDPPVVYNGEKKSSLYKIDMKTGRILNTFTPTGSIFTGAGVCRQSELDNSNDEKCDPVPIDTLTLTRTEYTVGIQSLEDGRNICTIKYSEWGTNTRDRDLHMQHAKSTNHRYIHTSFNGEIYALDHDDLQDNPADHEVTRKYHKRYSSPVVRVFDVARPLQPTSFDTSLILLPQPVDPAFATFENQNVFVDSTEAGSLYALSEARYPFVTSGALEAKCTRPDWSESNLESPIDLQSALIGVHHLNGDPSSPLQVPTIGDAGPLPPRLDAPSRNDVVDHQDNTLPLPPPTSSPRVVGFSYAQALVAVLLICLTGVGAGRLLPRSSLVPNVEPLPEPAKVEFPVAEPLTQPPEVEAPEIKPVEKSVKFQEDEKDKENEAVVDKDVLAPLDGEAGKPKKKAHRGKRGGKREAEKRALKESLQQEEIDGIVEGVKQMGDKNVSVTPDVIYQTDSREKDAPAGLLNLEIQTDQVLGHGSGGTLVFEGKFEGREVAVKRMLGQYSELASQEVSLLEQSEDHPNVIRYFCRRQDEHFLYIALELCQASLWEIYRDGRRDEVPDKYNDLLDEINGQPNRVLRQLAEGLKHLHTFRIVHRDIKPQNMLIAYPKKHTTATFPRIVISDFGLCKTLPEGASTLIGATVSAGTIGWKAPELIIQPKDSSGINASNHSTSKDSANGDFVGAQGIKRSTDIFSLGCVFFYVLTKGLHPFDDEEGWMGIRERNIKSNKCNLDAISIHGPDTVDLIRWMLEPKPEDRPTAAEVLAHPFFWNAEDRLEFLSLTSDRFDMEARDGTSAALARLESRAEDVIGAGPTTLNLSSFSASSRYNKSTANHNRSSSSHSDPNAGLNIPIPGEPNFLAALDKKFIDTLGKQRKYQGHKLVDLLRALRNKHHHWDDMPDDVKQRVGNVPEGYLRYWEQRFPKLTVSMWRVVKELGMCNERRYWRWYGGRVE